MKMNKIWMLAIAAGAGYAIYKMTQKEEAPAVAIPEASETTFTAAPVPVVQPDQVIHAPKLARAAAPAAPTKSLLSSRQPIRTQSRLLTARPSHMQVHMGRGKSQKLHRDAFLKKIKGRAMMRRA